MSAAGATLPQTLSGAQAYAKSFSRHPAGTTMDSDYTNVPLANVASITQGYNDQRNGALCTSADD